MKQLHLILSFLCCSLLIASGIQAQEEWPKTITAADGSILKIYEPQAESFSGNILKTRAAISLMEDGQAERIFGTFWAVSTVETDKDNRQVNLVSTKVPNLKFAEEKNVGRINFLKTTLETELPKLQISFFLDQLVASLDMRTEEKKLSKDLNNNPPKIFFSTKPSILVVTDGVPKFQRNDDWGVDVVVNSPFTIVKNDDGNYYLYGGKQWYRAPSATGPYTYMNNVPTSLSKIQAAVDNANNADPGFTNNSSTGNAVSDIIVSTQPAELIQVKGQPQFSDISGTGLSYVTNSDNDIFLDHNSNQYYVLLSGRWYKAPGLNGPWQFTAANSLPTGFAKIPEGSPKDNVLASVAGTDAAREAVMDAQIPQTAKVDRRNATATINYDGDPKFENIPGTHLQYAVNTQGSVLRYRDKYYAVDNGVWFESYNATGPWTVATDRPDEVDIIPPSYPVYNMKYVYVYDVDPDWVYMGYTPGYLNAYIYGPTVVYGTGFYYSPWWGHYYYPRPYTWGFSMHYNPWYGWNLGYNYGFGWLGIGFGINNRWGGSRGGWWGPAVYRPAFFSFGFANRSSGGVYGRSNGFALRSGPRTGSFTNNIYNYRHDVAVPGVVRGGTASTNTGRVNGVSNNQSPRSLGGNSIRGNLPANSASNSRPANNVTTDREGNVYQRSGSNQWQQRDQSQWKPVQNNQREVIQNLNHQQQMQQRGQVHTQNFQATRSAPPASRQQPSRSSGSGSNNNGHRGGH